ncbi:metallophosphoesterase, partial [Acidobacteriota bacterium]
MKLIRQEGKNRTRFSLVYLLIFSLFLFLNIANADALRIKDSAVSKIQWRWENVERIVVVGDLHGAYENFVKILKQTDLVDDQLNWIGGKSHLVQTGDILDRGDRARDIFDLLIKLEESATNAGGYVHILIGNHEEMNLSDTAFDIDEYITPKQFISFVSDRYLKRKQKGIGRLGSSEPGGSVPSDLEITQYFQQVIEKGKNNKTNVGRRSYYRNLNNTYGRWILNHNVVMKINDIIFVHAGITEQYSEINLEDINTIYRDELDAIRTAVLTERMPRIPVYDMRFYNNPSGPLWCRDFVRNNPENYKDDVERILTNLNANHMVVGHSPISKSGDKGMKLYEGKIWAVDTGISEYYQRRGGFVGALIIEN